MAYERLEMQGFLDGIKQVTEGMHPRRFCFVLGAGASRNSGIKTGQQLVDIWEGELVKRNRSSHEKWKQEKGITEDNKYSFYSQYYDRRYRRTPEDGLNFMEKMMEAAKPSAGYVVLSYLLAKTPHCVVVTTNFDHLTEDAVNYYAQTIPQVIPHEALAHYVSREIHRPTIVKIHRDLLLDPKNRPEELDKLDENWDKALADIFSVYCPIFIGYAGNDRSMMGFLLENSAKFQTGKWKVPYWMLFKADKLEGDVLSFVDKADGYVIRHEGFDETMFLIGNALGYEVPREETFLQDARDRYNALSDSIQDYSSNLDRLLSVGKTHGGDSLESANRSGGNTAAFSHTIRQTIDQEDSKDHRKMLLDAESLHNNGKYEEALRILQELVKSEPNNAEYLDRMGRTLLEMGRLQEALETQQKAVSLQPNDAQYQYNMGVTLRTLGRLEEALEAHQKAVSLRPNIAWYQNGLGVTLRKMGRLEEALEVHQKTVSMEPNFAWYHDRLGETLQAMERYPEAIEAFKKAIILDPTEEWFERDLREAQRMEKK